MSTPADVKEAVIRLGNNTDFKKVLAYLEQQENKAIESLVYSPNDSIYTNQGIVKGLRVATSTLRGKA